MAKRKANKSLLAWVKFVKKVQKEEKLSYKDAIHRAKQRKDRGESWMKGGGNDSSDGNDAGNDASNDNDSNSNNDNSNTDVDDGNDVNNDGSNDNGNMTGGKRTRRRRSRKSRRNRRSRRR